MKWCCSRNTTGVVIGSFYIATSIIYLIFKSIAYVEYEKKVEDIERRQNLKSEAIKSIITGFITVLISSIYIVAIVKRNQYFIIPWLLLGIYLFYVSCIFMYWWFIGAGMGGASIWIFLLLLGITVLTLGTQIAIFVFSCSMFQQIHEENSIKSLESEYLDLVTDKSFL